MHIQDTSGQDRPAPPTTRKARLAAWLCVALVTASAPLWITSPRTWFSQTEAISQKQLRIATVTRGTLVQDVAAQGKIITANSRTLYALAHGLVELPVVAGEHVRAGDVLATIASPELRSQLAQEHSAASSLRAQVVRTKLDAQLLESQAQTQLDQAQIDIQATQRALSAIQNAPRPGAFSKRELRELHDTLARAELRAKSARRDLSLHRKRKTLEVAAKSAQVARQDEVTKELTRQIESLKLKAPYEGQIGQLHVTPGSHVVAGTPILTLVDRSKFEVEVKIPESYAPEIGVGTPAQIRHLQQSYPAQVTTVAPEVVAQQVSVRLRFDEGTKLPSLRQHQRVSVQILVSEKRDVLMVTRGPFMQHGKGRRAWVVKDDQAIQTNIALGTQSTRAVEITQGLQEGDQIIIAGTDLLDPSNKTIKIHD